MYRKTVIVVLLATGLSIAGFTPFYSDYSKQAPWSWREKKIQNIVLEQVVSFQAYIKDTFLVVVQKDPDSQRIRQVFLKSRLLYKKFEWAAEYFAADLTERLNGPPVQEIENADLLDPTYARAIDPMGLQVIEESVYPQFDTSKKNELVSEVTNLVTNTDYLVSYFTDHPLADWRILDAAKLEVFRIIALGISGFDAQHSGSSINECAESLNSLQNILRWYVNKKDNPPLLQDITTAISYLHDNNDFDSFDRAFFITRFANKISAGIAQLERDLPGPKIRYNRMLNQEVRTLFDSGAFNVNAFSPGPEYHVTDAKIVLGQKLFYDASLSGTGTRSCASCHNPRLAFTDGLAKQRDLHDTSKLILRNVPTLLDAALQSNYFYDMRALTLEDQVKDVVANPHEMDGSMEGIIKYVSADTSYH